MNLFDIGKQKNELKKLEEETLKEEFWKNENSTKVLGKIKSIKKICDTVKKLEDETQNLIELTQLMKEDFDGEIKTEILKNTKNLEKEVEKLEIKTMLSGKYDLNNAIITIHPGAGGTESQDWAEMLYRMYTRWANKSNYEIKELDYLEGEEAGLKSVTFEIIGEYAYGYMKCEKGVHRLVRISPFDSGGRRHTSFASVEVTPDIKKDIDIKIDEKDLKIDVYRSTGAGGQGVNTTDSAVRITHLPSKIVVTCQNERSQIQNKEHALQVLKSKLLLLEEEKQARELSSIKGGQQNIEFGSQIRSYVMHPYSMVKDHRTNVETSNVSKVLDGDIDMFIEASLKGEK